MGKDLKRYNKKKIVHLIIFLLSIAFIALGICKVMTYSLNLGITWTLVFLVVLIASLINLTKPRDLNEEIRVNNDIDKYGGMDEEPNIEFELKELNRLRIERIITEEEYDLRKKEVLKKIK